MSDDNYMTMDQAESIIDQGMPQDRTGYLAILGDIMRYTKIKGVRKLSEASNPQLKIVAHKTFRDAEKKVNHYWKAAEEEDQDFVSDSYHRFLCDRFNIPESERENHPTSQLEEALVQ